MSELLAPLAFLTLWPWWTLALSAALAARALAVLALGPGGAAARGALALLAGGLLVAQLVVEGPALALLPLHAMAAVALLLLPTERPHPEPPPLKLGRNRRRRARAPLGRALVALLAVVAAAAWSLFGGR